MTGRGDWGAGVTWRRLVGKKGRKKGSWKDISSPGPLVCSLSAHGPFLLSAGGSCPLHLAVPSSVKGSLQVTRGSGPGGGGQGALLLQGHPSQP